MEWLYFIVYSSSDINKLKFQQYLSSSFTHCKFIDLAHDSPCKVDFGEAAFRHEVLVSFLGDIALH